LLDDSTKVIGSRGCPLALSDIPLDPKTEKCFTLSENCSQLGRVCTVDGRGSKYVDPTPVGSYYGYPMEEKIRTLSKLYARHFSAQLDTVRLRTGKTTERIKIDHPEAAAVVPFLDEQRILMVRQWRYAIERETLEIPAGKVDPGEDVEVCAIRELKEETGYEAKHLLHLFNYYPAIGYSNEIIRIYAASGLKCQPGEQDLDEISRVEVMELGRVLDLILQGRIFDGKTVIGISLFLAKQQRGEIPPGFF
jgi:ADP-ribose pyrophosphatase